MHEQWLDVLMQISRAIGTIRDRRKLMSAIMSQVTRAFDSERSSLYLHDAGNGELWTIVAQGYEDAVQPQLRIPDDFGICGRVFQTHESVCIEDTLENPHFARRIAESAGYVPRSMLVVPIMHAPSHCGGVLQVMDQRIGHFSKQDLPLLEAIAVHVEVCLENMRLHEAQQRQFNSFVRALSTALDARDPLTAIHSINVANYAMGIGEIMGMDRQEKERLRIAGLLHDIGKIGVPEAILTKPGKLLPDEYAEMQKHAQYSLDILSQIEFIEELDGVDIIASSHHERLDGSGYPSGLNADDVTLCARIVAVADVFDALTQTRHYRRSMTPYEAFKILKEMTPHQLDPQCVGALKAFLGFGPWPIA